MVAKIPAPNDVEEDLDGYTPWASWQTQQRDATYIDTSIPGRYSNSPKVSFMMRAADGLFSTHCPHCGSIEFRAVGTRNAVERAFLWLLQPCRCSLCGHHFFLFRWHAPLEGAT